MEKFKPNLEYFNLPKSNFFNNLVLSKYEFLPTELYSKSPCIYISPKTDEIDKNLIRKCIKGLAAQFEGDMGKGQIAGVL